MEAADANVGTITTKKSVRWFVSTEDSFDVNVTH